MTVFVFVCLFVCSNLFLPETFSVPKLSFVTFLKVMVENVSASLILLTGGRR